MKKPIKAIAMTVFFVIMTVFTVVPAYAADYALGVSGDEVKYIQAALKKLNLFDYDSITGYYGKVTESGVIKFQRAAFLPETGIVDDETLYMLTQFVPRDSVDLSGFSSELVEGKFGSFDWYKEAQYIFSKETDAMVTDVLTGRTFYIRRTFGSQHADTEPLTAEDSAIIKEIWGGGWSWDRRAVVVTVGEYNLAGSMTAFPHAGRDDKPAIAVCSGLSGGYGTGQNLDAVKGNGVSGVMCVHFLNSKNHGGGVQDNHQQAVKRANEYLNELWNKNN